MALYRRHVQELRNKLKKMASPHENPEQLTEWLAVAQTRLLFLQKEAAQQVENCFKDIKRDDKIQVEAARRKALGILETLIQLTPAEPSLGGKLLKAVQDFFLHSQHAVAVLVGCVTILGGAGVVFKLTDHGFEVKLADPQTPAGGVVQPPLGGTDGGTLVSVQPIPFDVAICHPRKAQELVPLNERLLIGALKATRPFVMECLVDPRSRGPGEKTQVTVKTMVTRLGGSHTVVGQNLTPEGYACVQREVETQLPSASLLTEEQTLEATIQFTHDTRTRSTVTFGIDDGTDFAGAVRLAQTHWCDCFAAFATEAPPLLNATVSLEKGQASAAQVLFDPMDSLEGEQLANCLQEKMLALPIKPSSVDLRMTLPLVHFQSLAKNADPNLPPRLRFSQLDLMHFRLNAESDLAAGTHENARAAHALAIQAFLKSPRKYRLPPLMEAVNKGPELVASGKRWEEVLVVRLAVVQEMRASVRELKPQHPSWRQTERELQEALDATQQELTKAREQLAADQDARPR